MAIRRFEISSTGGNMTAVVSLDLDETSMSEVERTVEVGRLLGPDILNLMNMSEGPVTVKEEGEQE